MDTSSLKAQSMGLHEELEGITMLEHKLISDKAKIDKQLEILQLRKATIKEAIDSNLDAQSEFWNDEYKYKPENPNNLTALDEYMLDSNQSIQAIATKYGITSAKLTRQIEEQLQHSLLY